MMILLKTKTKKEQVCPNYSIIVDIRLWDLLQCQGTIILRQRRGRPIYYAERRTTLPRIQNNIRMPQYPTMNEKISKYYQQTTSSSLQKQKTMSHTLKSTFMNLQKTISTSTTISCFHLSLSVWNG